MTLISILIGLAAEYFAGPLDRLRNFSWFDAWIDWLESRCNRFTFWDGAGGVLLTVAVPILLLLLVAWILGKIFIGLVFLLSILVFVYSLGPNLNSLLSHYTDALEGNMQEDIAVIEARLGLSGENPGRDLSTMLLRSHDYLFAVIFWYIILGMTGALLYSLVRALQGRYHDIHGAYAEAVRDLERILKWPSARLTAVGFAVAGSLVDSLDGWRNVSGETLHSSDQTISASGLGALQYQEQTDDGDDEQAGERYIRLTTEVQALINRSLIVWLTVLGLLTIGGFLG